MLLGYVENLIYNMSLFCNHSKKISIVATTFNGILDSIYERLSSMQKLFSFQFFTSELKN